MSDWLDLELAHELSPARAPEELWARVQAARRPKETRTAWTVFRWAAAVSMTLLIVTGTLTMGRHTGSLQSIATRELADSLPLQFRSGDAVEIATWLRRESGLVVSIPASARVQLQGARVVRERGAVIGEVAYRVGDGSAILLVAHADGRFHAPVKHGGLSWQTQQRVYATACSMVDQPQAACLLCHANL